MSHTVVMTGVAITVLLMALVTPGAAQCASLPPTIANTAAPSWLNAAATACVNSASGAVCTANCKDGYTSVPAPTVTCTGTTWGAAVGTCAQVCKTAPAPIAGTTWGNAANRNCANSIAVGGTCTSSCPAGTTGGYVARCSALSPSTNWTYSGGCVDNGGCPSAPPTLVLNSRYNPANANCLAANNGGVCNFDCNPTFVPSLSLGAKATCVDGVWNATGSCVKACLTPPPTILGGAWGACTNAPLGFVCSATCTAGTHTGAPTITCGAGGNWTRQVGGCAPNGGCPDAPPGVMNANPAPASCAGTGPGQKCIYTCNVGGAAGVTFGPSAGSAVTRTCTAGTWGNASADCIQVCRTSTLPALVGGTWNCPNVPVGQKCFGSCNIGNFGAPTSACTGAGFSTTVGSCSTTRVCAGVPTVSSGLNGRWPETCSNTAVGGKCNVECNNGLFSGSLNVECVTDNLTSGPGGVWSTTTAGTQCTAVSSGRKLI